MIEEDKIEPVKKYELPHIVESQLRRLGIQLDSFTPGQIEAAKQACMFDTKLIEDEHDPTFLGKLELTGAEKRKAECEKNNCDEETECHHGKFTKGIKRKRKTASYRELVTESRGNAEAARECDI